MTKKNRGRNEGSVFLTPSKRWRAQVYQAGKRVSRNFDSKPDALAWIRTMEVSMDRGFDLKGSSITLDEYLPKWLENRKVSLRPKTAHQYDRNIKNHILPLLGKTKLKDLRLVNIENYYSSLIQKGLGPRTIRIIHNILHSSLDKAVRYGLVVYNPTHGASLPKYHHEEMKVMDNDQVNKFLFAARTSPNYAIFHLAITTGMRMGELFGLKWSDIHWHSGEIHVLRQKQYVPGQGVCFVEPKTKAGRRTIKLYDESLDVLRHQKEYLEVLKSRAGERWHEMDLVFPSSVGTPSDASNIRIDLNWILELAGLPKIRFHDLRHTSASLLLNSNIPVIIVSNRLGHSKPSVTLDLYAHVFNNVQDEAARVMDSLVSPILVEIPEINVKTSRKQ